MEGQERRADSVSVLLERLRNPTELRIFLMAVVLGIGYVAIYLPLDTSIATTTRKLEEGRKRLEVAEQAELLQKQYRQIQSRIPKNPDASEWTQYVLNEVQRSPLNLVSFNPSLPQALGGCQILSIRIKVTGSLAEVDSFLSWIELNQRLFRVDSITLAPEGAPGAGIMGMDIVIVGVMG